MALERRRLWDWRMIVALTTAIAVVFIIYTAVVGQLKLDHERQANQLATQHLIGQITRLENAQTSTARIFEENQRRMLDYTQAQARRQAALLRYMRNHGIKLPVRFLSPIPVPHLSDTRTHRHRSSTSSSRTKSGTPSTTSGHSSPGKSGKHRHHPFRKRGH